MTSDGDLRSFNSSISEARRLVSELRANGKNVRSFV